MSIALPVFDSPDENPTPSGTPSNPLSVGVVGPVSGNPAAGPTGIAVPADADYMGFQDVTGKLLGVSAATPLPVGGTVTVVQPSGANLHVDVDSAPTITVVQPSGASLHVDVDSAPTTTIVQPSGANLHVDVDLAPTTTVIQPSGANLHVDVDAVPTTTVQQPSGANLHVDVDNLPATQPVSGTVTAVQPSGASLHVDVDNLPATQPVSGTVGVSGTVTVQTQTPVYVIDPQLRELLAQMVVELQVLNLIFAQELRLNDADLDSIRDEFFKVMTINNGV